MRVRTPPDEGGEEEEEGAIAEGEALTLFPEVLGEAAPEGLAPVAPQGVAQEVAEEASQEEEGEEGKGLKAPLGGQGAQGEEEGVPPGHEEADGKARLQEEGEGGEEEEGVHAGAGLRVAQRLPRRRTARMKRLKASLSSPRASSGRWRTSLANLSHPPTASFAPARPTTR